MKYPVAETTRVYELTYLLPGDKTSIQISSIDNAVKKLTKKHKLTIVAEEDWGKRPMAYSIKHAGVHHREANYKHMVFEADPINLNAFEKDLYLTNDIMRHLIVLAEAEVGSDIDEIREDETIEEDSRDGSRY